MHVQAVFIPFIFVRMEEKGKILIIDDNKDVLFALNLLLEPYMQKVKVAYTHIGYKAGDTPRKTASVTEGNCTVAYEYWREIYQKVEGGVWSGTGRYWYSDSEKMASLAEDKHITQFEAGHHYSYNIVLVANSGYFFSDEETVVSVGDYEWGTPSNHTNLETVSYTHLTLPTNSRV